MKKGHILTLVGLLVTSCSTTYIDARKLVIVQGAENEVIVQGSELKDNEATQTSELKAKLKGY
jgi:hypothetical protein